MKDTRLLHGWPSICSNMYYSIGFCNPHRHFKAWLAEPSVTNTAFGAIPGRVFLTGSIYGPNFQSQAGLSHFTCPEFLAVCRFFCPLKLRSQQLGQTCFASVLSQIVFPNGVKPQ